MGLILSRDKYTGYASTWGVLSRQTIYLVKIPDIGAPPHSGGMDNL